MCGQRQKASIYNIYTHIYICTYICYICLEQQRTESVKKTFQDLCLSKLVCLSPSPKCPFSPAYLVAPDLPCSMHGSSIPQFPIQHGQFSSQRHMQKIKRKKKQNIAAKTLNDGALQLTNRQWDRQTDRQANRRSDSETGSSRTAAQHTLGQLHTNTHSGTPRQGVSSHSLAAVPGTRLGTPAWGHHHNQHHHQHQHHICSPNWGPCFDGYVCFLTALPTSVGEESRSRLRSLCGLWNIERESSSSSSSSSLINWRHSLHLNSARSVARDSLLLLLLLLYFNYISFKCQQSCTTFFLHLVKQNAKKEREQNLLLDCDWNCYCCCCCCGGCSCESRCS